MVRKTKDGEVKWEELWGQQIFRSQAGDKQFIYALVRRKYGPQDVELVGPGEYVGIEQEPVYQMTTDNDPDSDTYGQRIPDEQVTYTGSGKEIRVKKQIGTNWRPLHEFNKKSIENYKKIVGLMPKPMGDTQYYWILKEGKYPANYNDFFEMSIDEVREKLVKNTSLRQKKKVKDEEEDAQ